MLPPDLLLSVIWRSGFAPPHLVAGLLTSTSPRRRRLLFAIALLASCANDPTNLGSSLCPSIPTPDIKVHSFASPNVALSMPQAQTAILLWLKQNLPQMLLLVTRRAQRRQVLAHKYHGWDKSGCSFPLDKYYDSRNFGGANKREHTDCMSYYQVDQFCLVPVPYKDVQLDINISQRLSSEYISYLENPVELLNEAAKAAEKDLWKILLSCSMKAFANHLKR
ncbi:ATP-dependent DNA helicase [Zea mays]|uniref:ATP-dependent DNA helicase n=1 Tax=Zea mays TaxID=4577 RepID=A0A3L6F9V3_MAIZE|nr:ATP-dependent DNA helicase [Zea mays]